MIKKLHLIGYLVGFAMLFGGLAAVVSAQTVVPRRNGKIAYVVGGISAPSGIWVMNQDGSDRKQLTLTSDVDRSYNPSWSPDGLKIVFMRWISPAQNGRTEIWVMDADGGNQRRLTSLNDVVWTRPSWSPDGSKIAFTGTTGLLLLINADGSNERSIGSGWFPDWSPDGTKLVVNDVSSGGLKVLKAEGGGETLITTPKSTDPYYSSDWGPAWSPDGARIVFNRSIDCEVLGDCVSTSIWTVNADGTNPAQVSDIPTYGLDWSADGTKIVFSAFLANSPDLFVMNTYGSGITNLTSTAAQEETHPAWQALDLGLPPGINPIDDTEFFIRQQYLDFLGREPDAAGLAGWKSVLNNCGITVAPPCDRIEVSAGFFRSEEFQARGYFVYRFYSVLGRIPISSEFFPDAARLSGFLSPAQLESNKAAYVDAVMARAEFQTKYASTFGNPTGYVDALLQTVGLPNHPSRTGWIALLNDSNTSKNRATVLRQLVESAEVYQEYYNEAFVIMQYFGYLRRTADAAYLNWIQTMNSNGGDYRIMINGFVNSTEYRQRFGT